MADEESEQKRIARVRELEEMVRKLENENKQLLNKVRRFILQNLPTKVVDLYQRLGSNQ